MKSWPDEIFDPDRFWRLVQRARPDPLSALRLGNSQVNSATRAKRRRPRCSAAPTPPSSAWAVTPRSTPPTSWPPATPASGCARSASRPAAAARRRRRPLRHLRTRDIHSANPLARRHERLPVVPFYDAASATRSSAPAAASSDEYSEEEAEAASWLLLPNPNDKVDEESGSPEYKSAEYLFTDMDPYLDLDLLSGEQKPHQVAASEQNKHFSADGVVPVQNKSEFGSGQYPGPVVDGFPTYEIDYLGSKPFMYNFTAQSISQSVSSSSLDVGVVPDHGAMADVSDSFGKAEAVPIPVSGLDREARVLRYKEKRKNRRFEKTIRYASRKAYAETRPRIKGRFAKRSELDVDSLIAADASYGVVPSF
ncbi:zinc finger protein constans-like 4 [Phtheirospermum japonicum]|uniref:Zinc finger protein constans-like 4 n=1 Tax=Phtheirospermum japonicum TaxID=374723 RepID=A0A830BCB5_9LAMI|nr:zinc finger protein constans-like 4 [Phtheirospermum japonicum]